jgi:hypothetical protein
MSTMTTCENDFFVLEKSELDMCFIPENMVFSMGTLDIIDSYIFTNFLPRKLAVKTPVNHMIMIRETSPRPGMLKPMYLVKKGPKIESSLLRMNCKIQKVRKRGSKMSNPAIKCPLADAEALNNVFLAILFLL